jgi:hypothetical protein
VHRRQVPVEDWQVPEQRSGQVAGHGARHPVLEGPDPHSVQGSGIVLREIDVQAGSHTPSTAQPGSDLRTAQAL